MEQLFQRIIEYGRFVREKRLDGLESWNNIKNLFSNKITCSYSKWKIVRIIDGVETRNIQKIYDYVHDVLGMDGDDTVDKTDHDTWSKKHFFLQLIRIIKNNPDFSLVMFFKQSIIISSKTITNEIINPWAKTLVLKSE